MMKRYLNLVLFLFIASVAMAQLPELTIEQHLEDYDYAVKYIEDNYSGFPDKVVDSTRADYEALKTRLRNQVVKGERQGWDAVAEYTAWFNDKHLSIHVQFKDEHGNVVGYSEKYRTKKSIHYESQMEYGPQPVACKVTNKTFLIRFPSCGGTNPDKKWIKNSVKKFKKSHCENLVIDIRGNGGGDDRNWYPYLALLIDHNAWEPTSEYRNTPQNIVKVKEMNWPIAGNLEKESKKHPEAEFIMGGLFQRVKVRKPDKRVHRAAVVIDNKVGSSAEGLLLALDAYSDRVTIYGRDNSSGCLDYANVCFVKLNHCGYIFQMPMSRKCGLPEGGIDATGIAPDVRIPLPLPAKLTDNIDEWVIWVAAQLEK